jgi:hypothetical protein
MSGLFLHRGSNHEKIMAKSGKETADNLRDLETSYGLVSQGKDNSSPTLARVAIIMAPSVLIYLHRHTLAKTILTEMKLLNMPKGFQTN